MTTDATRRVGVLLLAVAGACFAVGVPGLVNPAWATHAAAWLFMVGAGLPLLLLAWVEQREKSAVAGVQLRLDEARAWANELSNQEREARLSAPAVIDLGETENKAQRAREFEQAHWRVYYRRLWAAGEAYGWDIRTLTDPKRETRVTTQGGWNLATDKLAAAGVIDKTGGTRALVADSDWNAERMWERVPCPIGEPPEILPPPYTRLQTTRETTGKRESEPGPSRAVVEGTVTR